MRLLHRSLLGKKSLKPSKQTSFKTFLIYATYVACAIAHFSMLGYSQEDFAHFHEKNEDPFLYLHMTISLFVVFFSCKVDDDHLEGHESHFHRKEGAGVGGGYSEEDDGNAGSTVMPTTGAPAAATTQKQTFETAKEPFKGDVNAMWKEEEL
jgi:hypothetical protein